MDCPICCEPVDVSKTECPKCGVIYVKAFAKIANNQEQKDSSKSHKIEEEHIGTSKNWTKKLSPLKVGIPIVLIVLLILGIVDKFATLQKTNSQKNAIENLSKATKEKLNSCSGCVQNEYKVVQEFNDYLSIKKNTKLNNCLILCDSAIEFGGELGMEVLKIYKLPKKEFEAFAEKNYEILKMADFTHSDQLIVSLDISKLAYILNTKLNNKKYLDSYIESLDYKNSLELGEGLTQHIYEIESFEKMSAKMLSQSSNITEQILKEIESKGI